MKNKIMYSLLYGCVWCIPWLIHECITGFTGRFAAHGIVAAIGCFCALALFPYIQKYITTMERKVNLIVSLTLMAIWVIVMISTKSDKTTTAEGLKGFAGGVLVFFVGDNAYQIFQWFKKRFFVAIMFLPLFVNAQSSYPVTQVWSPAPYLKADSIPERPTIGSDISHIIDWSMYNEVTLMDDISHGVHYQFTDATIRIDWFLEENTVETMLWSFDSDSQKEIEDTLEFLKGEYCMVSPAGNVFTCENRLGIPTLVQYIKEKRMFFFTRLPFTTKG